MQLCTNQDDDDDDDIGAPRAPTRHSPYIEFHQDVGGSASNDLEGSSEHDHGELRISIKEELLKFGKLIRARAVIF